MLKKSLLSLTFLLAIPATQAFSVVMPGADCLAEDEGRFYQVIEVFSDNLVLAISGDVKMDVVIVAACNGADQLRVEVPQDLTWSVVEDLQAAAASTETVTFEDLRQRFYTGDTKAEITPISADLCACLTKDQ